MTRPAKLQRQCRGKLDFLKTFFLHINRLLELYSQVSFTSTGCNQNNEKELMESWRAGVRHLHILTVGYHDKTYRDKAVELQNKHLDPDVYRRKQFAALLRLAYRLGWLLEEDGSEKIVLGEQSHLIRSVRDRLYRRNMNWLAVVVGQTGTGKSMASLCLAQSIDPKFSIERVCFTPIEFLTLLESEKLKKGDAIVFDEAGIGMPAREFQSFSNKALGYILQSFRHENLAVIFNLPSLGLVDIQARNLFHSFIETVRIDYATKLNEMKFMNLQHNVRSGKSYFKYPRVRNPSGAYQAITRIHVGLPMDDLAAAYEAKKKDYCMTLKREMREGLQERRDKKDAPTTNRLNDALEAMKQNPIEGKITVHNIMARLGVSETTARQVRCVYDKEKKTMGSE